MHPEYGVILLCGGMSRRMGRPKCELSFGDETLLERTLRTLNTFSPRILVSAGPDQKFEGIDYPVVRDKEEGQGPLTGLIDLVSQMPETLEWKATLICSCDMPFLSLDAIQKLSQEFESDENSQIAIFEDSSRLHPFPGLYSRAVLCEIEKLAEDGKRKMFDLLQIDGVKSIPIEEHSDLSKQNVLMNVNTPEDYEKALKLAGFNN